MSLPDEALVVRGGLNLPDNFLQGSGVTLDEERRLCDVSVNAGAELTLEALTAPNPQTGYPGILNRQIGATTVGAIRACGGQVTLSPTRTNAHHATLTGLTPEQASQLFRPTQANPGRRQRSEEK